MNYITNRDVLLLPRNGDINENHKPEQRKHFQVPDAL